MIGRKIIDRVDDLLDASEPPNKRYLQPLPLRVDTRRRLTAGTVPNVWATSLPCRWLTTNCCLGVHEHDHKSQ